jgi:hypothetical protein
LPTIAGTGTGAGCHSGAVRRTVPLAFLTILVVGCTSSDDDGLLPPPCPPLPPEAEHCDNTCGNGALDVCWSSNWSDCPQVRRMLEECDGTLGATTCTEDGYYAGGEPVCSERCQRLGSLCVACAADNLACTQYTGDINAANGVVVSGARLAFAGSNFLLVTDGTDAVATIANLQATSIVATPGGWLAASRLPSALFVVPTEGSTTNVAFPPAAFDAELVAGPNNRVLATWIQGVAPRRVHAAIVDAGGVQMVAPWEVIDADASNAGTASDGTSFFLGAGGRLARIATDGTTLVTPGFPATPSEPGSIVTLAWAGTTGWYLAGSPTGGYTVQRFDASGALVGASFTLDQPLGDAIGDGDDLVLVRLDRTDATTAKLHLVRIDAAGVAGTPREIGVGVDQVNIGRWGNDLAVTWKTFSSLELARVALP